MSSPNQTLLPSHFANNDALREWIAHFVFANSGLIYKAIQQVGEIRGAEDSDDIVHSVLRRIDCLAAKSRLRATTENELRSLLFTIATHCLITKHRLQAQAKAFATELAAADSLRQRADQCQDDEQAAMLVANIMWRIPDKIDRHIFSLRVHGLTHAAIARFVRLKPDAVRQRWTRLLSELRDLEGDLDGE